MDPHERIDTHFRLTAPHAAALRKLGLETLQDLLFHFPTRYERAGSESRVAQLVSGSKVTLYGTLSKLEAKRLWKSRRTATEGWFEDASGRVKVLWFNQPYIAKMAPQGVPIKLTGTVAGKDKPYITNPEIEPVGESGIPAPLFNDTPETDLTLYPVYPETSGITSKWFFHAVGKILASGTHKHIADVVPHEILRRYHLPDMETALVWIHTPQKETHAETARKRFSFDEIFLLSVVRALERAKNDALPGFLIEKSEPLVEKFLASIPFPPTGAQRRAIAEILADIQKPHPMARLLEGDVGSGKTLVAAATAYTIVQSRPRNQSFGTLQVAYMAPTEILATQHFTSFVEYFRDLPINIGLITGSACRKFPSKTHRGEVTDISRSQLLKWVASGEIAMLVGTHALIQKAVKFKHLACAIVDEQHRFGTRQRQELSHKGDAMPHFLSMTATPIPRTLALTIYGDLDLSVLDELPPGRAKITTKIVMPEHRDSAYEAIRAELKKGRQAYVICPRIEEPDPEKLNALQAKSAKAESTRLQKEVFPEYRVGLLHGAMTPKEKDEAMRAFTAHELDILVATSVVEVGVNVPNATAILIEGAERFGLAQLHQLRGRVQRSSHPPLCFLLPETKGAHAMRRLKALEKSSNGFELADADLEARGAGDLYGRRQWGVSDLGMEALRNPRLIEAARTEAYALIQADPSLTAHEALKRRIDQERGTPHRE